MGNLFLQLIFVSARYKRKVLAELFTSLIRGRASVYAESKAGLYKMNSVSVYFYNVPILLAIIDSLNGLVAQSVEQRIENPCVGGSIPPRATKNLIAHLLDYFFWAWKD